MPEHAHAAINATQTISRLVRLDPTVNDSNSLRDFWATNSLAKFNLNKLTNQTDNDTLRKVWVHLTRSFHTFGHSRNPQKGIVSSKGVSAEDNGDEIATPLPSLEFG